MSVHPKDKHAKFQRKTPTKMKTVKARADRWFSRFVRLSGTQDSGNTRVGKCCTCSKFLKIVELDCGHFQSRRYDQTRWDTRNTHVQCVSCNNFNAGQQYVMGLFLDKKYGEGTAMSITAKSRINQRFPKFQIESMANKFKSDCEFILGMELSEAKWRELIHQWRL